MSNYPKFDAESKGWYEEVDEHAASLVRTGNSPDDAMKLAVEMVNVGRRQITTSISQRDFETMRYTAGMNREETKP